MSSIQYGRLRDWVGIRFGSKKNKGTPTLRLPTTGNPDSFAHTTGDTLSEVLTNRPLPTIDNILTDYQLDRSHIKELPQRFGENALTILEPYLAEGTPPDYNNIDAIYRAFAATRGLSQSHPLYAFSQTLNSLEDFLTTYAPSFPYSAKGRLVIHGISRFTLERLHPEGVITYSINSYSHENSTGVYDMHGEWVEQTVGRGATRKKYIRRDVLEEVVDLLDDGFTRSGLFHATGSGALPGIEQERAIISSNEALNRSIPIRSGTIVFSAPVGKDEVFASEKFPALNYYGNTSISWFDQYPVIFGLEETSHRNPSEKLEVKSWLSNEKLLGEEVSLDFVGTVYVWAHKKDEIRKWTRVNCPWARIVSLEARQAIETSIQNE